MKNTISHIQTLALPKESNAKKIVMVGLGVLALLVAMYVYFVGKIVFDVVARRTAEGSIRKAESAIGMLEASYFKEMKTLDLATASNLGLVESKNILHASRPKTVGMVHEI